MAQVKQMSLHVCERFCVVVLCFLPDLVWSCVVVFTAAISLKKFLLSMGADDRSKGKGWHTQKEKGWMAGQIRKEELLAKPVKID